MRQALKTPLHDKARQLGYSEEHCRGEQQGRSTALLSAMPETMAKAAFPLFDHRVL